MNFAAAGARAAAKTGLAWTSNLLVMVRLCLAEPAEQRLFCKDRRVSA